MMAFLERELTCGGRALLLRYCTLQAEAAHLISLQGPDRISYAPDAASFRSVYLIGFTIRGRQHVAANVGCAVI